MYIFDESLVIAICFIIFVYLAYRPIKKSIIISLDNRIIEIKNQLTETEKLKKDAKLLLEEMHQEMHNFEKKKHEMIENANNSTQKLIETKTHEMDLVLKSTTKSAMESINSQKTQATDEMRIAFTDSVLKIVRDYLIETKNNNTSDEEILKHFIKK